MPQAPPAPALRFQESTSGEAKSAGSEGPRPSAAKLIFESKLSAVAWLLCCAGAQLRERAAVLCSPRPVPLLLALALAGALFFLSPALQPAPPTGRQPLSPALPTACFRAIDLIKGHQPAGTKAGVQGQAQGLSQAAKGALARALGMPAAPQA